MTPEVFGTIVASFLWGAAVGMLVEMYSAARCRAKQVHYSALSSPRRIQVKVNHEDR